jgi:long-chain acyl-CoA synthetase
VLSHGNAATIGTIVEGLDFIRPDDLSYLYLPLAHVFAQTVQIGSFEAGTAIVYFSGDTKQIIPELTETHPTYLPSVPRIFEKLYSMATAQVAKSSPEEREQFFAAIKIGVKVRELERRGEPVPRSCASRSPRPIRGSSPPSAGCSATRSARPSPAPRRSRRRSSSSSTPAGSRSSRATA